MLLTKREPAESLWANSSWENAISRQKISSFPLWYRSLVKRGFFTEVPGHTGVQEAQGTTVPLSANSILLPIHFHVACIMKTTWYKSGFPWFVSICLSGDCSNYFWLNPDQEKFLFLRSFIYKTTNYWNYFFSKTVISEIRWRNKFQKVQKLFFLLLLFLFLNIGIKFSKASDKYNIQKYRTQHMKDILIWNKLVKVPVLCQ